MSFKFDTREKFTIITSDTDVLNDILTADFSNRILNCLHQDVKNVILKMTNVNYINANFAKQIAQCHKQFYEKGASFVICELQPEVENLLETLDLKDVLNITPTESEAWDIVQMEELERELIKDENAEFNDQDAQMF